ncbi:pupal cuticle protein Edg-78E [Drosophila tropicalis]|uniref:pupal cuticle protein Edg-78E n=1 Tax=Drosophila tropicalis TaxID=46794 RepID=UPI0035ABD3F3
MLKQAVILVIVMVALASSTEDYPQAELIETKNVQNLDGAGQFEYNVKVSNGIDQYAKGNVNSIQGEYFIPAPDGGKPIRVTYTADSQGFHPHIEN